MDYPYKFEEIELGKLVKSVVADFEVLAFAKKLDFTIIFAPNDIFVKADPRMLQQVVQNLVDNAIKYTDHGFVKVEMKTDKESAVVSVTDSGLGISEKFFPRLFEEKARENRAQQMAEGNGEGIYFAKIIAQDHGGTILAESKGEGQGSMFSLVLPKVTTQ